jgi:hypothetical protein
MEIKQLVKSPLPAHAGSSIEDSLKSATRNQLKSNINCNDVNVNSSYFYLLLNYLSF